MAATTTTTLSAAAKKTTGQLRRALPEREWAAVAAWLTTFYPYQLEWILDWTRFALLTKARQIGGSHGYAAATTLWGMLGETTTVVSMGQTESDEFIGKVALHARALARLGSTWAAPVGDPSTSRVKLRSGGRIIGLPSTSGGRGYAGNVVLDEFAYHAQPERTWDAAAGTVTHGFKLRVLSTPNGVGNNWHRLVTDPREHEGYVLHQVTIDEAIAQGLRVEMDALWKQARGDPRIFDQLFRCKFLDGNLQYIPSEFVKEALEEYVPEELTGDAYAGLDIGESRDRTSLVVVKRLGPSIRLRHVESHARTDDELIDDLVARAFGVYGAKRLCADATGIGSIPSKRLKRRWGMRFEPVEFTNSVKEELATGLYDVMSEGQLHYTRSYRPDESAEDEAQALRDDICAIRRIVTAAGNVRYDAPRTRKGHADRAWALMLANHASGSLLPVSKIRRHRGVCGSSWG